MLCVKQFHEPTGRKAIDRARSLSTEAPQLFPNYIQLPFTSIKRREPLCVLLRRTFILPCTFCCCCEKIIFLAMPSHYKGEETPELVKYVKETDTTTIKPRALSIIWAGDARYWKLAPEDGPAELMQVSWLEVSGQVSMSRFLNKAAKEYSVKFRVELKPDNFGWGDGPVYLMVRAANGTRSWKKADLSIKSPGEVFDVPMDRLLTFRAPESCGAPNDKLQFGIYEIWRGRWKGGLVIHEVVIEPVPQAH